MLALSKGVTDGRFMSMVISSIWKRLTSARRELLMIRVPSCTSARQHR